MKNLKIASGLMIAMAMFATSCSDDRDHNPTALEPTTFVLNEPVDGTANILLQNTSGIDFTWSQPDYGTTVVPTYTIQMSTDANFGDIPGKDDNGNEITVSSVSTLVSGLSVVNTSVTGKDINSAILKNYMIESADDLTAALQAKGGYIPVYLRATSTFDDKTIYSNTVSIQTLPYFVEPVLFTPYYIVGAITGWSTASTKMNALLYPLSDKEYSYTTVWEGDANLKFWETEDYGDWGKAWSTPVDGDNSPSGNLVKDGSGAMVCPEPGAVYTYSINMGDNTYAWTKYDNQSPAEYGIISITGVNGDWDTDYDFEQVYPHNWCLQGYTFTAKTEFKFRAEHAWDANWGVALDINDIPYGAGKSNGDNITAPAGTFTIYFNDITGEFVFVKQ